MSKRVATILISLSIVLVTAGVVLAVLWAHKEESEDALCPSLSIDISDTDLYTFITTSEIDAMLRRDGLYPVGKPMNQISLQQIENAVKAHPMVQNAECYTAPNNAIFLTLSQRRPVLEVRNGTENYLVDAERTRMQMPTHGMEKVHVLNVVGKVGQRMATNDLLNFALWLRKDEYWNSRIAYVSVLDAHHIQLIQRGDSAPSILLGDLTAYDSKLHKLRVFYDNGGMQLQKAPYREWDVRYKGQIVGRK